MLVHACNRCASVIDGPSEILINGERLELDFCPEDLEAVREVILSMAGSDDQAEPVGEEGPVGRHTLRQAAWAQRKREDAAEIRVWARERRLFVHPKGRIPLAIQNAYDEWKAQSGVT